MTQNILHYKYLFLMFKNYKSDSMLYYLYSARSINVRFLTVDKYQQSKIILEIIDQMCAAVYFYHNKSFSSIAFQTKE